MHPFGSVEWAAQERVTWQRYRKSGVVGFWSCWLLVCFLAWCIAVASITWIRIFDGVVVGLNVRTMLVNWRLKRSAEEMLARVDLIRTNMERMQHANGRWKV